MQGQRALTFNELQRFVAGSPAFPERTAALEARIQIGTRYHGKWYRSQKEHWLGWLVVQRFMAAQKGQASQSILVKGIWNRLKCSPLMYWLAEVSEVGPDLLELAENAAVTATAANPKDGHPHGKIFRQVIPWELIEASIEKRETLTTNDEAEFAANSAFARLSDLRPAFRKLMPVQIATP